MGLAVQGSQGRALLPALRHRAVLAHEVSQGYKTVKEKSAFVRFKVKGSENTWLYAWTTTPWTLPSNVALCVNPDEEYAKFDFDGRTVIMAKALIHTVLGEDAEITNLTTFPGMELVGHGIRAAVRLPEGSCGQARVARGVPTATSP